MRINRGDIVLADLEPVRGSEQGGIRPVLIIQNDIYNKYSPVTIIASITSKEFSKEFLTNIYLPKIESGLDKNSTVMLNQVRTIDKRRIIKIISTLSPFIMDKVDEALKVSLNLN